MRDYAAFKELRDGTWPMNKRSFEKQCSVSFMTNAHYGGVSSIAREAFGTKFTSTDLLAEMRRSETIGAVVLFRSRVIGFVIYRFHHTTVEILRMAVASEFRRRSVGTALIEWVQHHRHARPRVIFLVRETLLPAQLFLASKEVGFKAIGVKREAFADTGEDAFVFEWRSREQS